MIKVWHAKGQKCFETGSVHQVWVKRRGAWCTAERTKTSQDSYSFSWFTTFFSTSLEVLIATEHATLSCVFNTQHEKCTCTWTHTAQLTHLMWVTISMNTNYEENRWMNKVGFLSVWATCFSYCSARFLHNVKHSERSTGIKWSKNLALFFISSFFFKLSGGKPKWRPSKVAFGGKLSWATLRHRAVQSKVKVPVIVNVCPPHLILPLREQWPAGVLRPEIIERSNIQL